MKELKIMSPRMPPNLSNLSTAAVKSRNLFLGGEGRRNRLKLPNSITPERSNQKQNQLSIIQHFSPTVYNSLRTILKY